MTDCCTPPAATPRYRIAGSPRPQTDAVLSKIHILQMDCPVEEGLIRKKLGAMSGVGSLQFNLLQRVLTVSHAADALPSVLAAISELGLPLPCKMAVPRQQSLSRLSPGGRWPWPGCWRWGPKSAIGWPCQRG